MQAENFKYQHDKSIQLNREENERIVEAVEKENGIILSLAIVQLYLSREPKHKSWYRHACGIVCLVKDMNKRSYFYRIYNLNSNIIWEEEVYTSFNYFRISDYFYFFPGKKCNVGLNFAFLDEAHKFFLVTRKVAQQVNANQKKLKENSNSNQIAKQLNTNNIYNTQKAGKKNVDIRSIGTPTNFVHVNHIGLNGDVFDVQLNDSSSENKIICEVLKNLNIQPNRQTLEYADKFIQSHGGYQVFNNASIIYHKNLIDKKANSSINQDLHKHKIAEPIILKHSFKRKPKLQAPVKPKDDANVTHNEPKETLQSPQIKPNRNLPIKAPQTLTTFAKHLPPAPTTPTLEKSVDILYTQVTKRSQSADTVNGILNKSVPSTTTTTPEIKPQINKNMPNVQPFIPPAPALPSFMSSFTPAPDVPPPPPPKTYLKDIDQTSETSSSFSDTSSQIHLEHSNKSDLNESFDTRSELLRSIENFKGNLNHVEKKSKDKVVAESGVIINSLIDALAKMRPYLRDSSDEENEDFEEANDQLRQRF